MATRPASDFHPWCVGDVPVLSGECAFGVAEPRVFVPAAGGRELTPENSRGFEFVQWCIRRLHWTPLPWQQIAAIRMLELHPDGSGRYRFRRVVIMVGRQQGKTQLAAALALWRMETHETNKLVYGVAQVVDTARECWQRAWDSGVASGLLIDSEAAKQSGSQENARQYNANGRERFVWLLDLNDEECLRTYQIGALNRRARGKSIDFLVLDELREQQAWDGWAAISKTTNARPLAQLLAISNAGDELSVVLNQLLGRGRAAAERGGDYAGDLCLLEWSGQDACELTDVDQLRQACPAIGHTTPLEVVLQQAVDEPPEIVRTELLCQSVLNLASALDVDAWVTMADPRSATLAGRKGLDLCLEMGVDKRHATLIAATPVDKRGMIRVEVAKAWSQGVGSVEMRGELRELIRRARPRKVGFFPKGPGVVLLPDLRIACRKAGVLPPVPITEVAACCLGLDSLIDTRRVIHAGEALLHAQISGATRRNLGDLWVFQRTAGGPSVDAVYALAGAAYLALLDDGGLHRDEGGGPDDGEGGTSEESPGTHH